MNWRLMIWVTSICNMKCPLCNQSHSLKETKGYQMSMEEVHYIVESCKDRGYHFDQIELVGGEMTLWTNLKQGIEEFKKITNHIYFVTNGTNPEIAADSGVHHWIVSMSQCPKHLIEEHTKYGSRVVFHNHSHKKVPEQPIPNTLPARCVVAVNTFNGSQPEIGVVYIQGKVYFCNMVLALTNKEPVEEGMVCDFDDDFMSFYGGERKYDKKICQYCLCNNKVWLAIS